MSNYGAFFTINLKTAEHQFKFDSFLSTSLISEIIKLFSVNLLNYQSNFNVSLLFLFVL